MSMPMQKRAQLPDEIVQLNARSQDVRDYKGTAQSKAFIEHLQALETMYMQDLVGCTAETLGARQALVRQVRALQKVLRGESDNGRV